MGFTIELAYPSQVTTSNTQWLIFCSQSPQTVGNRFNTKNGAHNITNVKKTTPSTLVAFCSSRIIRPCRDEFLDITLELREWWDRTVPQRVNKHGVDLLVFVLLITLSIFDTELSMLRVELIPGPMPLISFIILFWFLSVAERRNADVVCGNLFDVSNVVWWLLPKLVPRRDFCIRRVSLDKNDKLLWRKPIIYQKKIGSFLHVKKYPVKLHYPSYHVTTELDFVWGVVEKLSFRIGIGVGDVAGVVVAELLWMPLFGAESKCNEGAELPICITFEVDDEFFKKVTVPVDGLHVAIRIVLWFIINGDSSSLDIILTSAGFSVLDLDELPNHRHLPEKRYKYSISISIHKKSLN